jgi:hypothetical protein
MKQKFEVTGMTGVPHGMIDVAGAPSDCICAGGVNPPLRQGFAPRGKTLVRAIRRGAEHAMPWEVLR